MPYKYKPTRKQNKSEYGADRQVCHFYIQACNTILAGAVKKACLQIKFILTAIPGRLLSKFAEKSIVSSTALFASRPRGNLLWV